MSENSELFDSLTRDATHVLTMATEMEDGAAGTLEDLAEAVRLRGRRSARKNVALKPNSVVRYRQHSTADRHILRIAGALAVVAIVILLVAGCNGPDNGTGYSACGLYSTNPGNSACHSSGYLGYLAKRYGWTFVKLLVQAGELIISAS
jgi:hypothetical protein